MQDVKSVQAGSVGAMAASAEPASQARPAPSGGSESRAAGSVGATAASAGPPQARPAPSGGSEPRAAGSVGAKILLVKLSSLGDVVHALPVVRDIRAAFPDAQIDWAAEKAFVPLLALHPQLHRVIACEIRRWRKSPLSALTRQQWNAFKSDLGQEAYDAVIDLQGLTKSAVVARLARLAPGGKRYALANQTDGSGYEAPTRWLADVAIPITPRIHAVQRSRELAALALGYRLSSPPDFGLKVPVAQENTAQAATENIAKKIVFVHGTSRADKEWPLAHWLELGRRFNAAGWQVVLPHGNGKEEATSRQIADALNQAAPGQAMVWPLLPLDALTREIARAAGVIGVDSGISHIAVALDLPHVQLYNFDTAWRTGPDPVSGRQASVFAQPAPAVEAVWQAWLACLGAAQAGPAASDGASDASDSTGPASAAPPAA
ncbi:MAG: lipopolysaccharide heptosyltransferase [Polaromonas sp.]|nr:lipopolysaccharide heptosyltransferase [Polaromonas sp.]